MTIFEKTRLLFWTTRYLQPSQLWHRMSKMGRHRLRRWRRPTAPRPTTVRTVASAALYQGLATLPCPETCPVLYRAALAVAADLQKNTFCFLNKPVTLPTEIDWHDPALSQLWRYHLHYFGYVDALLLQAQLQDRAVAYQTFRRLASSWIAGNQVMLGDGWHPYTISLRLVNWLHATQGFAAQLAADEVFHQTLVRSMVGQAQFLAANLEFDVRGNHLLENLRALLWAGLMIEGPQATRWYERALHLLQIEVAEQVLPDGGHFERTPTYHLVVFKDLLEIALWLQRNHRGNFIWLDAAIQRMADYLLTILPPNHLPPLLKDTALDAAPHATDLLAVAALYCANPTYKIAAELGLYPRLLFDEQDCQRFEAMAVASPNAAAQSSYLPDSGYVVMRDGEQADFMILDVGKPCPDYLPAHAHADLFSYELTIGGQKVVVDSGVYEYTAGPWRNFFRSTRAHNTVALMGQNQSEVWGSFRVARRARPTVHYRQETDDALIVQASHDGYQRLATATQHRRTVLWVKRSFWLVVDEVMGQGIAAAQNYLHLHPTLAFEAVAPALWQITNTVVPLWLAATGQQQDELSSGVTVPAYQGWYSEEFGKLQPNPVLTMSTTSLQPMVMAYVIAKAYQPVITLIDAQHKPAIQVTVGHKTVTLTDLNSSPRIL